MRSIAQLDISTVKPEILNYVRMHVQKYPQAFDYAQIQRVSNAAAPLSKWVVANLKYIEIYTKIEPLMKAADEANAKLNSFRVNLKKI